MKPMKPEGATKTAKPRSATDWERIEHEYRAGQLSVSEIGRRYGVSEGAVRKRAKRDGWSKDLSPLVRQAIRAKLTQADAASGTSEQAESTSPQRARTDSEIVEEAADRGVAVIESHRRDIEQLDRLSRVLADRLEAHLDGRQINEPYLGEKESPADLLEKLSRVRQRTITLGRQAFNLDEVKEHGESLADLLSALPMRVVTHEVE